MHYDEALALKLKEHTAPESYTTFADINLAELVCAIRVSQSYKVTNMNKNGNPVVEYVNERCYYGSRPSLGQNSILLFLYLHFLNPSAYGHVLLCVSEAADFLGITTKSVRSNLKSLMRRGYILCEPNERGFYDVSILSYASRNKSVSEGGRGYISMPFSVFREIAQSSRAGNINELRMQIRGFISCLPGKNHDRYDGIPIRDLQKSFPSYVRRTDVKRILMKDTVLHFFHVKLNSAFCFLQTKEEFDITSIKKGHMEENAGIIKDAIKEISRQYASSGFHFAPGDIMDIARISLRFSVDDVICGIRMLFANYTATDVHGKIGALVRALTEESAFNRLVLSP